MCLRIIERTASIFGHEEASHKYFTFILHGKSTRILSRSINQTGWAISEDYVYEGSFKSKCSPYNNVDVTASMINEQSDEKGDLQVLAVVFTG